MCVEELLGGVVKLLGPRQPLSPNLHTLMAVMTEEGGDQEERGPTEMTKESQGNRPAVASNDQESGGSPKISPATIVPDGRTLLNVELVEEGIKMNPESSVRHYLCFDDGRGWRQRAELKRRPGADLGGRLSFSVRVPKYRRALHRRSEVDVTVETILCVGGRTRVLTSQPTVISFKAAKSRKGARVTFKKLHREESYTDLQEVLEVLAEAGVQVETVSGEIEPPLVDEQADVEELIASVPCSPLPLPFLSEGEMQALVEDLKDDLATLDPLGTCASRSGTVASIKKGDLIEYKAGEGVEEQWFRVMVTSKGKSTGRNRNYINLRYADGSEGGVYINHHEWRFVEGDGNHQVLTGHQENRKGEEREKKEGVEQSQRGAGGGARGRKRASMEMFGLEDSLSNMALDFGPVLSKATSFSAIRV